MMLVSALLLCGLLTFLPAPLEADPKCKPVDWTQQGGYPLWGTCNWPNRDQNTPCGNVVVVPGKGEGHRAWPFGTCTLKFSRTPWAPRTYSQEEDKSWLCGTRFAVCTKSTVGSNSTNTTSPPIKCGGKVSGTERPCPDEQEGYECRLGNATFPHSNCASDGKDLVLDVSTMGYPPQFATTRVETAEQCAEMCGLRLGCNMWNYCGMREGCGWSCQEYFTKEVQQKESSGLKKEYIIAIAAGAGALLLLVVILVWWLLLRRSRRQRQQKADAAKQTAASYPMAPMPDHPTKPPQYPPAAAPYPPTHPHTVGYPAYGPQHPQSVMDSATSLPPMPHTNGASSLPPSVHTSVASLQQMGGRMSSSPGPLSSPGGPPGRAMLMYTSSGSEAHTETSSAITPVSYGLPDGRAGMVPQGGGPRNQRPGANHAVL